MRRVDASFYKCPACLTAFTLIDRKSDKDNVIEGELTCANGHHFIVNQGIPDFTWPKELANVDQATKDLYNKLAADYEKFASIPFQTFKEKEEDVAYRCLNPSCPKQLERLLGLPKTATSALQNGNVA